MSRRNGIASGLSHLGEGSFRIAMLSCLAGLTGTAYFLVTTRPFQFPHDDSYIALEFTRNLAATGRVSYDGIHTTPGATTLLHILLLAIPARIGIPLQLASLTLGVSCFVLLIWRVAAVTMDLTRKWEAALYASLMTALTGYLVFDSVNGMETTLFMLLTVVAVGSVLKTSEQGRGYWRPALWLYLTALTRPEGYWLAASLVLYLVVLAARGRPGIAGRARLGAYLAGAALLALLTQWMIIGAIRPHTALAKVYLFNQFRLPLHIRWMIYADKLQIIWGPLLLALLPALGAKKTRPLGMAILPWILITQAMFLLLLPNEVGTYHGRYLHPFMPFLFILAGDGFSVLLHKTGEYRIPRWAVAVFLAALTGIVYFNLITLCGAYSNDKAGIRNNHIWAVQWLKANAPPGIVVATHDVGAIRYLGRYTLVDVSGLTDEEAMARNRAERGQAAYLISRHPDYLVGDLGWLTSNLHYSAVLKCCATLVATAHPNSLHSLCLRIYRLDWSNEPAHPR